MSITLNYSIKPVITGDFKFSQLFQAPASVDSFAQILEIEIATFLDIASLGARALLIVPPVGNTNSINLKLATDTTGINLSPDAPNIISLATAPQTIRITVGSTTSLLIGRL